LENYRRDIERLSTRPHDQRPFKAYRSIPDLKMVHLVWWGVMVLELATTAQEPPHFEIDVIFPRNET